MAEIELTVSTEGMDEAIEKANRLVELLREAQRIIDSLGCGTIHVDDVIKGLNRHQHESCRIELG